MAKETTQARYTIDELARAAQKLFSISGALVRTALAETKREKFTLDEANSIVKAFAKRPVRRE